MRGDIFFHFHLSSQLLDKKCQTTSTGSIGGKVQEKLIDSQNARSWMSVIVGLQLGTTLDERPFGECIQDLTTSTTNQSGHKFEVCTSAPMHFVCKLHQNT